MINIMPKAIDLRVKGMTFHEAIKRLATTPPPANAKAAKKASKPKRKK
jgi:hypothetical protein